MDFFEIILSPFVFIIKQLFLFSYGITANYGSAIVLLSLFISSLLLPVFIIIEKAKKKDDIVKNKMQPLVDEIKRAYKGQERYYYLKTLNRQYNYSPFKALVPILSLLLQIPFFIAAYQFLENLDELQGVSFLIIKDLSLADGILGGVHFLPIAMTLVNLLTAYFYTRNGNKTERIQMLIVALVFLILLYNLPAALLLYWTMNNVFSFFRLFVTNPEVFKRKVEIITIEKSKSSSFKTKFMEVLPKVKIAFVILASILILTQLKWALKNNFDDIVLRIIAVSIASIIISALFGLILLLVNRLRSKFDNVKIKPIYFYSFYFLALYFYFAAQYYYSGVSFSLSIKALLFLIPSQVLGFILLFKVKNRTSITLFKTIISLLLFVFIAQVLNLIAHLGSHGVSISILNAHILIKNSSISNIVFVGLVFSSILAVVLYFTSELDSFKNKKNILTYSLSVLYVFGLIFLWNPLMVFSTSPESFSFSAYDILKVNFPLFIVSLITSIFLFLIIGNKLKKVLLITSLLVLIVSIVNSFIVPLNLGTLQMHRFSEIDNLLKSNLYYLLEAILMLAAIIGIEFLLRKSYQRQIVYALILLNVILISQSLFVSTRTGHFFNNEFVSKSRLNTSKNALGNKNVKSGLETTKSISFSKDKKNVLVFVADMFQGWYLRTILEENRDIEKELSGFKWYPNTVSITNYTSTSAPSILMGYDYTPDKLDLDSTRELKEKVKEAHLKLIEKVKSKGYNYTSTQIPYSSVDNNDYGVNIPLWTDDWNFLMPVLNIGNATEQEYSLLWQNAMFFCSPLFVKPNIYRNGNWMYKASKNNENTKLTKHYNLLRALPYISDTKSENPSFIYVWTKASHFPWDLVDDNGKFHPNVQPYKNNKWVMEKIVNWIKWMKKNGVYDNTRIIILSDHGIRDTKVNSNIMITNPFIPENPEKISLKQLLCFTPLMMVKDYNDTNKINEDWRFLSNVDATAISLSENDPTKIEPPLDRTLTAFYVSWKIKAYSKKLPIVNSYEVNKNVYEIKNWKKIK